MRILSVDPGYERVGVAIIEKLPHERERLLFSDCILTSAKDPFEKRLVEIGAAVAHIIEKHHPAALALERLYFEKNRKTAIRVSEACGVIRYVAASHTLSVYEYTPLEIKIAVAGDGHASKKQVMDMVPRLINLKKKIKFDDEYDAIAVGLTCLACLPHHKHS